MTREEKFEMYSALNKRELIELILDNQEMLNNVIEIAKQNTFTNSPNVTWEPSSPWWGINHPSTGDPIGPTYTTTS